MTGLIAAAPFSSSILENDGFWPDIDLDRMRAEMRLDGQASGARVREAAALAMISVNAELEGWKASQEAEGRLDAIPQAMIAGEPRLVWLYRRAVSANAAAVIVERYRGYDASPDSAKKAEDERALIGELRRDEHWAIAQIQGKSRLIVGLV